VYGCQELVHLVGDVKLESSDATALQKFARPCESPACLDWLHALQLDDGMVDTFAARHPLARRRATCWEQYRARRYENGGTRIDYIFVDEVSVLSSSDQGKMGGVERERE
jgi:exonuclease III